MHRLDQKTPAYHHVTSDLRCWGISQGWVSQHGRQLEAISGTVGPATTQLCLEVIKAGKYRLLIPYSTYPLSQIPEMPAASPKPWTLEKSKVEGGVEGNVTYAVPVFKVLTFANFTKTCVAGSSLWLGRGSSWNLSILFSTASLFPGVCMQCHQGAVKRVTNPAGGDKRKTLPRRYLILQTEKEAAGREEILVLKNQQETLIMGVALNIWCG